MDPDCRARALRRWIATMSALWYPQSKALFCRKLSRCYMEAIIQGLSSKKKKKKMYINEAAGTELFIVALLKVFDGLLFALLFCL